ncbi:MAG: MFS transporter [Acidimicrobiaceae bacterium]|nr:MFS transporter [Acidimicrobiaceae bacterium]
MPRHRILMDITPVRESRDFRLIFGGQAVSVLGNQLTQVAVPFQVYALTHSSFDVGLVSLIQLFPLLACSLLGGSLIDAVDRRRLLIVVEALMACSSAGLAVNTDVGPHLWVLFVLPAVTAGLSGIDNPTRNAMIPSLVPTTQIPAGTALFQVLNQFGSVAGPSVGGLLLAGPGLKFVFWVDVVSFAVSILAASAMSPQPPSVAGQRPGLRSVAEGLRFVRGHQAIQGAYLIDINAMVFGMPRALFPALALHHFGGGARTVGFLYAAPGVGAFFGALTTGWVSRVRRQGVVVTVAVVIWGCAIAAFGLVPWLALGLVLLAVAGWADVISALFRNMIIQFSTPDRMRGRLLGLQIGVVAGGPRLGDLEAGSVATLFGNQVSVVSGGLACVVGALGLVRLLPEFRRVELRPGANPDDEEDEGLPAKEAVAD